MALVRYLEGEAILEQEARERRKGTSAMHPYFRVFPVFKSAKIASTWLKPCNFVIVVVVVVEC